MEESSNEDMCVQSSWDFGSTIEYKKEVHFTELNSKKEASRCKWSSSILRKKEKFYGNIRHSQSLEQLENLHFLVQLPTDLQQHILTCNCACGHLGFGNYSTLSLPHFTNGCLLHSPDVVYEKKIAKNKEESPHSNKKSPNNEKCIDSSTCVMLGPKYVACFVLLLAGIAGVGVSVPLALKSTSNGEESLSLEKRLEIARDILALSPLVDGHNDLPWNIRKFMHNKLYSFNFTADLSNLRPWSRSVWSHTDLPRLLKGQVGAQFWVSYVPCDSIHLNAVQLTIEQIDLIKRLVAQYPDYLEMATTADEVEKIFKEGRIASLIGVEGGHSIQTSLAVLRALYDLGVRYMTLTHTCSTSWAEAAPGKNELKSLYSPDGLTPFGKSVVHEMNRIGIMVDLSHVSQATMRAALETSRAPVIFSHSSVYAICKNPRNVPDDILEKVAKNRGIVMVSFFNHFLTCGENASIADVIKHINHVRYTAGLDHVGIGSCFDGVNRLPEGLEDVSRYPFLIAELLQDDLWSIQDIQKLTGLNFLRVMREVEEVKEELRKEGISPYEDEPPATKSECAYRFIKPIDEE